jgi:type IV pilus biogenesis protein CpaD/CtpE
LPPGCATAMSIAAQTTAPTDLLVGRPLPPGAALPYAQAIERYYRRNDAARKQDQSDQQDAGGDSGATAPAGTGSASAPGSAANPLLGGVPAQAH